MFEWVVQFTKETKSGEKKAMKLRTEFLVVTAGPLTNPKLPRIPGVSKFKGTRFHTARWEYRANGRSPEDATFDKLRHKRVGSANADAWTTFPSYAALVGGPAIASLTRETLPYYVDRLHEIDLPRQDRIWKRVHNAVKNPEFTDSLTPWYPDWCKRPCFHDDYLHTFNKPNVILWTRRVELLMLSRSLVSYVTTRNTQSTS
ncbi:hypothetical protein ACKLNR_009385 [Fusarium oxysporum f. sp. zingiberi]